MEVNQIFQRSKLYLHPPVLFQERLHLQLEAVHAKDLDGLRVRAVVVMHQGCVVRGGHLGQDGTVQEVGDVDHGRGHRQRGEIEELGADGPAGFAALGDAVVVVLRDNSITIR